MEFPDSRIVANGSLLRPRDVAELSRQVRWAYDGTPPVLPGDGLANIDEVAMWFVRDGSATLRWQDEQWHVPAGQWVLPPTPAQLTQAFSPGTRLLSLRFAARWTSGVPLLTLDRPLVLDGNAYPELLRHAQRIVRATGSLAPVEAMRLLSQSMPLEQLLQIDAGISALLATLLPILTANGLRPRARPQRLDARVERAVEMLRQSDISPREIAGRLSISVSQLDRLFMRAIGTTPHALRQRQRLDLARQRLRQSDEPIKAIAYAAGFRRVSHFSAWFSKAMGLSPRAYRQRGDALA